MSVPTFYPYLDASIVTPTYTIFPENIVIGAGGFEYTSSTDSIVAHAAGGQSSATVLTSQKNNVITAASPGASVLLPPSGAGLTVQVINNGANSIQVFGTSPDTINGVATGTGVPQPVGSTVSYTCTTAGAWYSSAAGTQAAAGLGVMGVAHAIYNVLVDGGGAPGAVTPAINATIPANAILIGATINSPTALAATGGAANIEIGTTAGSSATSILTSTAKGTFTTDAVVNGTVTLAAPVKMSAAGSINITSITNPFTTGLVEIFVYYVTAVNA